MLFVVSFGSPGDVRQDVAYENQMFTEFTAVYGPRHKDSMAVIAENRNVNVFLTKM